ncbi:hypothetical protein KIN20_007021 [Parelaphostrongylus tenuis]|uniref:Uncharacterized protein n=1 Tax=Parelaphostrongylus tenuis TaxID=148309 RepID=A0AAD5M2N7_PARTN|nr:hypothetical protein KIN20_007021 [Parelaphostrongylus tenuis]
MAKVEQVCTTTPAEVPEGTTDQAVDESAAPNNGVEKTAHVHYMCVNMWVLVCARVHLMCMWVRAYI